MRSVATIAAVPFYVLWICARFILAQIQFSRLPSEVRVELEDYAGFPVVD